MYTLGMVAITLIVGSAASWYVFHPPRLIEAKKERAEVENVIEAVRAHLVLPEGEEPTIATVTDLKQLEGQPFFKNAKIGHKVLIYTEAKKAILYDPTIDRIVEVAPLNIGTE